MRVRGAARTGRGRLLLLIQSAAQIVAQKGAFHRHSLAAAAGDTNIVAAAVGGGGSVVSGEEGVEHQVVELGPGLFVLDQAATQGTNEDFFVVVVKQN